MDDAGARDRGQQRSAGDRQNARRPRDRVSQAQRQHHDAAADQPVGAERERPVAEAAGKPDRIVGAERPDVGEQPDETDERRALAGERPGAEQFTMRERQFLQPTN